MAVSLFGVELAVNGEATTASERERRVERIIEAISTSKAPLEFESTSQEFEMLFAGAKAADLEELRFHDNLSIALSAAWEEMRVAASRPRYGTAQKYGGQWFVGYVEGRLGVPVPEVWGSVIAGSEFRDGLAGFKRPDRVPYHSSSYGKATPGISIARKGNSLFLKSPDIVVPLAPAIRKQLPGNLSVELGLGRQQLCVSVSAPMQSVPFPLFCIDSQSGEILWRAQVWGSGFTPFLSGPGFYHWVGLVRSNQLLIVFGMDNQAAYIEGFAASDGSNVFRFSTAYRLMSLMREDSR